MKQESEIQLEILDWLNRQRVFFAWRNNSVGIYDATKGVYRKKGTFDIKGGSDIFCVVNGGKLFAIEVKRKDGKESDAQKAFGKKILKMGAYYCCARSLDDVILYVNKEIYGLDR